MNQKRYLPLLAIAALVIAGAGFFFYQSISRNAGEQDRQPLALQVHSDREMTANEKTITQRLTVAAIGDVLIHDRVFMDAETTDGYDFKPMLAAVKSELQKPDILLANQETILGGVELGLSGYPTFNSPIEVGEALIDAGVDIVSTANNHTLDKGEKGIQRSMDYLETAGLPYVGSYKDDTDRQRLRILEKNGISIAFLSYTYGTNGIPVPEGKDFLVNLIDKEAMKEEIHRAKEQADTVIMSIHWGNEYQRYPDSIQEDLAQFLADEGVDIVFGHHPHVLQPVEWVTGKDGSRTLIVYSLGNFLSGQMWDYKDIGGMASVEIVKTVSAEGTKIELANPQFYPTYVASQGQANYRVVPLSEAGKHGLKNADAMYQEILEHMSVE